MQPPTHCVRASGVASPTRCVVGSRYVFSFPFTGIALACEEPAAGANSRNRTATDHQRHTAISTRFSELTGGLVRMRLLRLSGWLARRI